MPHSINETIRILRNLRGYKQSYMASRMGVSQQDYSHLEKHGKKITNDQVIIICKILEINEDFITAFEPTLFFKQFQKKKIVSGIHEDLLRVIDERDDDVTKALKVHIIRLLENINGLRKQVKEQNETIKDLRQALLKKWGGVKI